MDARQQGSRGQRRPRRPARLALRLEPSLESDQPQLLEPADLGLSEPLVATVGKRRPAPEAQRVLRSSPREQRFESVGIDVAIVDAQEIARALGDQTSLTEQLAELTDVPLERGRRRRSRCLPLERVDQPLRRNDSVPLQQEEDEQNPQPTARERKDTPSAGDLERTEDEELELSAVSRS